MLEDLQRTRMLGILTKWLSSSTLIDINFRTNKMETEFIDLSNVRLTLDTNIGQMTIVGEYTDDLNPHTLSVNCYIKYDDNEKPFHCQFVGDLTRDISSPLCPETPILDMLSNAVIEVKNRIYIKEKVCPINLSDISKKVFDEVQSLSDIEREVFSECKGNMLTYIIGVKRVFLRIIIGDTMIRALISDCTEKGETEFLEEYVPLEEHNLNDTTQLMVKFILSVKKLINDVHPV